MSKIGVFWVYRGAVFGKAVGLDAGVVGVPGILDSPDNHADVWEQERPWALVSGALAGVEYQDVPRGRVLFLSAQGRPLVYADKVLMDARSRALISAYFGFTPGDAVWKRDAHYTTSASDIDRLFSDDDQ